MDIMNAHWRIRIEIDGRIRVSRTRIIPKRAKGEYFGLGIIKCFLDPGIDIIVQIVVIIIFLFGRDDCHLVQWEQGRLVPDIIQVERDRQC